MEVEKRVEMERIARGDSRCRESGRGGDEGKKSRRGKRRMWREYRGEENAGRRGRVIDEFGGGAW